MIATNSDIVDLVTVTVEGLGGNADGIRLSGDNILVGSVSIPITNIKACTNSAKTFLSLIKRVLKL